MGDKKLKIMSLSVEHETQDNLKQAAKKMGLSVSALVRTLVKRHLDLVVPTGDEVPVILKVPGHLQGDETGLREWFTIKTDALVEALSKKE